MATSIKTRSLGRPALAVFLLVGIAGCGQTQVAPQHRELVLRLATGASTKDQAIMDRVAAEVDEMKASGTLSDDEQSAFLAILDASKQNKWDKAQELAYALRDGQHPTGEDQERVAKRTLPGMKKFAKGKNAR